MSSTWALVLNGEDPLLSKKKRGGGSPLEKPHFSLILSFHKFFFFFIEMIAEILLKEIKL